MKTSNRALKKIALLALSLTVSACAFAQQSPDNVQGDWTIYSTNIDDGATVIKHVQIAQYGDRITGYFEGPKQSGPIQGRVNGHHIVFSTVTRNVLTFRGQIYGDNMSGNYGIHGKHAPWQAVRPATTAALPVPSGTGTVDVTQPVLAPPVTQSTYQYGAPAPQYAAPPQNTAPASQPIRPPQTTNPASQTSAAPAPLSPDQLDSLVAPIALYPDALLAQVLAATTNPDEVTYADDWLAQNKTLTGTVLAQAVDQQSWDPSIKALTQFASVLDNLAHNLSWTSSLGQAFANQQADVMAAVQRMRAKAQAAGTLQSNSQITVTQPIASTIVIQPANPAVVYVPQYNPTIVYGAPVVVPFYVPPPLPVAQVGVFFGSGVTIGAGFGGSGWGAGFGWGWHTWSVNWGCCGGGGSTVIIHNNTTYINNRTYNGYHNWGPGTPAGNGRGYVGSNGYYHPDPGYHPGTDTHYGPNGGYHPNGYFGPNGGWHSDSMNQPNGGNNGNHGLIGGNGGMQNPNALGSQRTGAAAPTSDNNRGQLLAQNRDENNRFSGAEQNRSRFSGDGRANRAESARGRGSMARAHQSHMGREHTSAGHHGSGGARRT